MEHFTTDQLASGTTHEARVPDAARMEPGSMKMAKVGERRVVLIRSASGLHALDNACPHQGYGLTTGALDGELLTCQWHNWKFDVRTGRCVMGEEDVPCHNVRVDGDDAIVRVTEPSDEEQRARLWPSLRRGIERNYVGQMSRDVARLIDAGATADEIIAEGLRLCIPRTEWGMGHEMAVSADLATIADGLSGLEKTLAITHALAGLSEIARDRPAHDDPVSVSSAGDRATFLHAIEHEDWDTSVSALRRFAADVGDVGEIRSWFIEAVSQHHLSYGHGAIYVQKAFDLIDRMPEMTDLLLSELALTLINSTREDTLPYMVKTMRAIDDVDLSALAAAPADQSWDEEDKLVQLLFEAETLPIGPLVDAALAGAGVPGIINAVSLAGARQLLALSLEIDRDTSTDFGWLDITHVVTYANAARWAWSVDPGPHTARLVLLTAFLAFDAAGRGQKRDAYTHQASTESATADLFAVLMSRQPDEAIASAIAGDPEVVADALERASMEVSGGSFIVTAHMIKLAVAARTEASATGSNLPLAATARFIAAPRTERFVAGNVREAIGFVETGQPPAR